MNAEHLLTHFDRIADAPDAMLRLRRFILDLAVRGKLVEQDPNDEPASELLKRIAAEKKRLVEAGKVRKNRTEPEVSEALPYDLPSGWEWVPFGLVHYLVRGVTYSKSDVADGPMPGYVAILRANNIGSNLSHDEPVFVKRERVSPDQFLRSGDFMIALSSGSKNLVGKAAFVPEDFGEAFGGFCGVIRLYAPQTQGFVGVYLRSGLYRESISAGSRGIGINNLKKEILSNLVFPLPPLAEQHRIVAKVDELMALCDRLETARKKRETTRNRLATASLARLNAPDPGPTVFQNHASFALDNLASLTTRPDQIKALRQTILNLAVRGKLVEQDPEDEPASELLKRIAAEKVQLARVGKVKKTKALPPIDTTNAPFILPAGWTWARFPEIGIFGRGKSKHRPRNDPVLYEDGTYPFIQTGDVAQSGGSIETYSSLYNDIGLAQSAMWPAGTLCITIAANIADSGILTFDACFPDSVVGLIVHDSFENARFFEYFLRTAKNDLHEFAPSTAQKNINLGILMDVLIPLPPLAEQRRIVTKVDELMTLCDPLEASLATGSDIRGRLLAVQIHDALALASLASTKHSAKESRPS